MSLPDEQNPNHNLDQPGEDPAGPSLPGQSSAPLESPGANSLSSLPDVGLTNPPAFVLPAIPIAPTRDPSATPSRALRSGDDLFDLVRGPLAPLPATGQSADAEPAFAPGDHLTDALRRHLPGDTGAEPNSFAVPAFPITPIRPFTAPLHAEMTPDDPTPLDPHSPPEQGARGPSHSATWVSNNADSPYSSPPGTRTATEQPAIAPPDFRLEPEPVIRIPNFGHLLILGVIALFGFVAAGLSVQAAFHFHLWGIKTIEQAATDVHYTLASMAVLYLVSFAGAFFLFPRLWNRSFFSALQWNAPAAVRYRRWLAAAAAFCFILAIVDEFVLPGPTNAPIDKMFTNTAAAWLLFAFGVTVAPFFEEMTFRGFILPALCTAVDWAISKRNGEPQLPLGPNGHPQWSRAAMIVGSLLTSLPFAAMHADQIAHSVGPLILLYCVSLVLCFARLATRSLAASTLVHASYNFILFSFMLIGTGGFRHLDKM